VTLAPARAVPAAGDRGVVITEIDPTGHAAESGLQAGDVIIEVGNRAVTTPADVRKTIDEARSQSKRAILLRMLSLLTEIHSNFQQINPSSIRF
jgi:serine protease Do